LSLAGAEQPDLPQPDAEWQVPVPADGSEVTAHQELAL
jgi:hypothetical protein